jgi:hypothetical protein
LVEGTQGSSIGIPLGLVTSEKGSGSGSASGANGAPQVGRELIREGMKATDDSVKAMERTGIPHSVVSYTDKDGHQRYTAPQQAIKLYESQGKAVYREYASYPADGTVRIVGHAHDAGRSSFSTGRNSDVSTGALHPVMKNYDGHSARYDMYYQGWRYYFKADGQPFGNPSRY